MADLEPTESFDDELLSAYVDGELDADQRARVEERLRNDPSAMQLVEEMQELSTTLQALPQERVGRELHQAVMQQIEDQVISTASGDVGGSSVRRWAWAAAAIAATLVLSVFLPEENGNREVAKVIEKPKAEGGGVPELRAPMAVISDESSSVEEVAAEPSLEEMEVAVDSDAPEQDKEGGEAGDEVFMVHIAPTDARLGQQQFDELLLYNGIMIESEPLAARSSKTEVVEKSDQLNEALPAEESSPEGEAVLVEATASQIENLLMTCNTDTKNWESVSFGSQTDDSLPVPRWRSLERAGRGMAKPSFGKAMAAPTEGKTIAARESKDAAMKADALPRGQELSKGLPQRAFSQQGRATRLGRTWSQSIGQNQMRTDLGKKGPSAGESQIQVLFVLRSEEPPETKETVSGKKAAAGK